MTTGNPWRRPVRPLVCAHKGHAAACPEQTISAFTRAIELGADMIEADVRRSRDGHLVLMHDPTVDRTTDGTGMVAAHSFEELRRLEAGSWWSSEFSDVRIPSAEEALGLALEHRRIIAFDIKGPSGEDAALEDESQDSLAVDVALLIREHDALGSAVISSFRHRCLAAARAAVPAVAIAPWMPEDRPADPVRDLAAVRALDAEIMIHTHSLLTDALMTAVRNADVALWAWTPTDPASLDACLRHRPDAIDGDDVTAMVGAIERAAAAGGRRS